VLLTTLLLTLLFFAVSLLLGILIIVMRAEWRGVHPDLTFAYRYIAAPVAALAGAIVLVYVAFLEIRHYRQARALAQLERMI
jgi:hypothetical protein